MNAHPCFTTLFVATLATLTTGCAIETGASENDVVTARHDRFAEMELEGELTTTNAQEPEQAVFEQLRYTVGALNHRCAVGQLAAIEMHAIELVPHADGTTGVHYRAAMPVVWRGGCAAGPLEPPTQLELRLPRHVDAEGLSRFAATYGSDCVAAWEHAPTEPVDATNMWYHYRPGRCELAEDDIVRVRAKLTAKHTSSEATYPEYDAIWQDGALEVVAVFSKEHPGATEADWGIWAYESFRNRLYRTAGVKRVQGGVPGDETYRAQYADGRTIEIVTLLVDDITAPDASFEARYDQVSADADVIIHTGPSRLGESARSFARQGQVLPGQYQIVFLNSGNSFAFDDGELARRRADVNPDDPQGTRHVDLITNSARRYPDEMHYAPLGMIQALRRGLSYRQMLRINRDNIGRAHAIERFPTEHGTVVTGDEDNVYQPAPSQTLD